MAVSEVDAILSILGRVCTFANTIQDRYYEGSKKVASFRSKCLVLEKKHAEWQKQLRKFGAEVKSNGLLDLASEADKIRKEQIRELEKLERNRFRTWRRMASGMASLTNLLVRMEEIVDAGPKLLQSKVDNHALLEQLLSITPAPLTFGFDDKYVPILESVDEVQTALQNEETALQNKGVVTLYGIPGLGKTSLAKYLALKYTAEKDHGMNETPPRTPRFPDGVQYMFCGKGSQDKVKELLQGLLECLGFATDPAASSDGAVISSLRRKLTKCLAKQTMLIIFDDVWEPAILEQLLVPAPEVRYLITSQNKEIYSDAKKIELEKPTDEEASRILANHTSGLQTKGQFPVSIRDVTNGIMGKLENHPLSLSNIGVSIDSRKATDVRHWEAKKDDLVGVLGAPSGVIGQPSLFDSTYKLRVKASMMLMVDSLVGEARSLLFLMALFEERLVKEELLKFFYSLIVENAHVSATYDMYVKYLKDRLVIEMLSRGTKNMLLTHGLRMLYIQEEKDEELKNIAHQIQSRVIDERRAALIRTGDSEETLAAILGASYFRGSFRKIFIGALEEHSRIMLAGKGSAGNQEVIGNCSEFAWKPNECFTDVVIKRLNPFLNFDGGRGDSEQKAHLYAKKIIIKFVCQRTVDDSSLARLLQLQTSEGTAKACNLLGGIIFCARASRARADGNPLGETLKVLLHHMNKNPTRSVITTVGEVLPYRGLHDDTSLGILAKWGDMWANSNPPIQLAIMQTLPHVVPFASHGALPINRISEFVICINRISKLVMNVIESAKDGQMRLAAVRTIDALIKGRLPPMRLLVTPLAVTPAALTNVFDLFISGIATENVNIYQATENVKVAGATLGKLAVFPENKRIYRDVNGGLESLCNILAKMEETWRAALIRGKKDRGIVEERGTLSAGILAELAIEKQLREIIASRPGLEDSLLFLQLVEMGKLAIKTQESIERKDPRFELSTINSTRALTTLFSTSASGYTDLPPFEQVLEVFSLDEMPSSSPIVYLSVYWSRVEAHLRMGTYGKVLANLDLAAPLLNSIQGNRLWSEVCVQTTRLWYMKSATNVFRDVRIFVKAMLGDTGALLGAYDGVTVESESWRFERKVYELWRLIDRGVLKRLRGDLQGALQDLNLAFERCTEWSPQLKYNCLKHRGYVRHLMGNDEEGATKDAESANELKLQGRATDIDYDDIGRFWSLQALPVEYLGFVL